MARLVVLLGLLLLALVAATTTEKRFAQWALSHNKQYASSAELQNAIQNFEASLQRIAKLNAVSRSFNHTDPAVFGLNMFSDLSPSEFRARYLMPARPVTQSSQAPLQPKKNISIPPSYDWRDKNAVTAVKNQEQCGSCWAFSATEAIESAWILAGQGNISTVILAPQQIVDCDTQGQDEGCNGGFTQGAFEYVVNAGGLELEKNYPYQGVDGQCNSSTSLEVAKISGFKNANSNDDEKEMVANLVSYGPLSICVDASNWQDYQSGTMSHWQCAWFLQLDHCVQLVGYDQTDSSNAYYKVRNSWTTGWGIDGYIHLEMYEDTCGLAKEPTWPLAKAGVIS